MIKAVFTFFIFVGIATAHEYHVSVCDVNFNTQKKVLEVTQRIFADDLENALKARNIELNVMDKGDYALNDPQFRKYIEKNIEVTSNGETMAINWLGHELKSDQIVCYYEIELPSEFEVVKLKNTLLMEQFKDQKNIMHWKKDKQNKKSFILDKKTKSAQLSI